jgi:2,4-dienoyl-CoA reductase-like NADH-dependent reductase (Old Yellow Enzyme family)
MRDVSCRNRIFVSPMCQYSCTDGMPVDWHLVHLGSRSVGGAGLVMAEATAVVPEGRISAADAGLWNDEQAQAWARIASFVREHGAVPAIQLAHAGRKASSAVPWLGQGTVAPGHGGWQPLGPSAIPFDPADAPPREMTAGELDDVVERFVDAARRAVTAGFQVVELHMAHGYLLHSFLSPLSNRRDDRYGGSLDNRMRLPLGVAAAVRDAWPEHLPLFVRVSATDWVEGGWDLEQTVEFARRLQTLGVDLIDCSSGGAVPDATIPAGPGFQVRFAEVVRREAGVATGAVGWITEPEQADTIVATGQADAVLLAREMLRDPYWPQRAARALGVPPPRPRQYERS